MKSITDKIREKHLEKNLQESSREKMQLFEGEDTQDELTPEFTQAIKVLWEDPLIQKETNSKDYAVSESVSYYFNDMDRISQSNYVPTDQDMLMARIRTAGIVEMSFQMANTPFRLVDVGGQRSERKKWIHCFEDVTAIIFVAALSDYDLVLREDEETNRMEETLVLFDEICNSAWFDKAAMILFLNKKDLFEKKIMDESSPDLSFCFSDYTGGRDYQKALEFMQEKFVSLNRNSQKRIYPHVTCATDTEQVRTVMRAVNDAIMAQMIVTSSM
jgi:GTPase SAR1 family protein